MPRTVRNRSESSLLRALARHVNASAVRGLFARYCREVAHFSDAIAVETAPFELTFRDPHGFVVVVSPLRELFLVSIGDNRSLDIRVSSVEGFVSALDLTLNYYLAVQSRIRSTA